MRSVAYIPDTANRREAARFARLVADQAAAASCEITHITADPAEATRLRAAGHVDKIIVAEAAHATHLDPDLIVADRPRRGIAAIPAAVGAGLSALLATGREHKLATLATVAMVAAMATGPMLSPNLPDLVPPPVAATPPPVESYPGLPPAEPEPVPEVVPPAQGVQAQPPAEVPEMEPVAVAQPVPEPPAATPPPRATPPAPTPAPEPTEPAPDPTEPPEPPPADPDPPLLCVDLGALGLIGIKLCL